MKSQVADHPPKLRRDGRLRLPSRRILTGFRQRTPRIASEAINHHRFAIPDAHGRVAIRTAHACSGRYRKRAPRISSEAIHHHRFAIPDAHPRVAFHAARACSGRFRKRAPRIASEAIHHHRFAIPDAHPHIAISADAPSPAPPPTPSLPGSTGLRRRPPGVDPGRHRNRSGRWDPGPSAGGSWRADS